MISHLSPIDDRSDLTVVRRKHDIRVFKTLRGKYVAAIRLPVYGESFVLGQYDHAYDAEFWAKVCFVTHY